MRHRSYVLLPFLIIFTLLIGLADNILKNSFYRQNELEKSILLDEFSLLQIETIRRIKEEFLTYNPEDFSFTAGKWTVDIRFIEELAEIEYRADESVFSELTYDMVFENVLSYRLVEDTQSDSD